MKPSDIETDFLKAHTTSTGGEMAFTESPPDYEPAQSVSQSVIGEGQMDEIKKWIRGLQEAATQVGTKQGIMKDGAIAYLLGYIESSKYII